MFVYNLQFTVSKWSRAASDEDQKKGLHGNVEGVQSPDWIKHQKKRKASHHSISN